MGLLKSASQGPHPALCREPQQNVLACTDERQLFRIALPSDSGCRTRCPALSSQDTMQWGLTRRAPRSFSEIAFGKENDQGTL